MIVVLIAVGAALGAMTRHGIARRFPGSSATWAANMIGSAMLGLLVGVAPSAGVMAGLGIGYCGALTTVSSLMLDVAEKPPSRSTRLLTLNLVGGLVAAGAGLIVGRLL